MSTNKPSIGSVVHEIAIEFENVFSNSDFSTLKV